MNDEERIATDEVLEDIQQLDKLFDKEYLDIEQYHKIKSNMIDRIIAISEYYE